MCKYVDRNGLATKRSARCHTRGESVVSIVHIRWSMQVRGSILVLKPRADVTRSPKQVYQWPHNRTDVLCKKDWCPLKKENTKHQHWIHNQNIYSYSSPDFIWNIVGSCSVFRITPTKFGSIQWTHWWWNMESTGSGSSQIICKNPRWRITIWMWRRRGSFKVFKEIDFDIWFEI